MGLINDLSIKKPLEKDNIHIVSKYQYRSEFLIIIFLQYV